MLNFFCKHSVCNTEVERGVSFFSTISGGEAEGLSGWLLRIACDITDILVNTQECCALISDNRVQPIIWCYRRMMVSLWILASKGLPQEVGSAW